MSLLYPSRIVNWVSNIDYYWVTKHFLGATVFFTLSTMGLLFTFQTNLIYQPNLPEGSRSKVENPSKFELPYDEVVIRTKDNVKLAAYLIKRATDDETRMAPTIVYFHANAGNMGHRLPIAEVFYRTLKCNVLMLSYRGYGFSEGAPEEKGIKLDSEAALDFIVNHELLKGNKIILYGQSIGGAVAIDLASRFENKIHGLIVENTFLSLPKLIPSVLPLLSRVAFLCHQIWDSEKAISKIKSIPTLFLSGENDSLIPPKHMKDLFEKLPASVPKKLLTFPNGDHNDTFLRPGYFQAIDNFWKEFISKS